MLPAPAQGAIMMVCRNGDDFCLNACHHFNDADTALCTKIERDFLRTLYGGCSTPISALAVIKNDVVYFKGNILSPDGKEKAELESSAPIFDRVNMGAKMALQLLQKGGQAIAENIRKNSLSINGEV
jgi:hydroxymethylbilane synthase